MLGELMGAGFGLWDQMGDEQRELQRRWASVVAGDDRGRRVRRLDAGLARLRPTTRPTCRSPPPSADAIARGDFLIVLGDFHGGDNPLAQGLFGLRHPDPAALLRRIAAEAGPGVHLSPPRRGVVEMTARSWPMYPEGDVVVVSGDEPAPAGTRRVALEDVVVDDGHVSDRAGSFRVPLARVPLPADLRRRAAQLRPGRRRATGARQIGRLVVRRASWSAPPASCREDDLAAWARDAASHAACSPARRSSASRATSTSRARRCAAR